MGSLDFVNGSQIKALKAKARGLCSISIVRKKEGERQKRNKEKDWEGLKKKKKKTTSVSTPCEHSDLLCKS
jgi:hypothetical protein